MDDEVDEASVEARVRAILDDAVDGVHGESERRLVGEFLRDALDDGEDPALVARFAEYVSDVALELKKEIEGAIKGGD
jgi:hypothetical protein